MKTKADVPIHKQAMREQDALDLLKRCPNRTFSELARDFAAKHKMTYDEAFVLLRKLEWK